MPKVLISACLLGQPVRYDGHRLRGLAPLPVQWFADAWLIPFCPEAAGGLSVPRSPAEIQGGTGQDVMDGRCPVLDREGRDLTASFVAGARAALAAARSHNLSMALLKDRSPSCGSRCVYDGSFTGTLMPGQGVTAALLACHGIEVFCENRIEDACRFLNRAAGYSLGCPARDRLTGAC